MKVLAGRGAENRRAETVRVPTPTRALLRARKEHAAYAAGREVLLRRSVVRGLMALALAVLLVSMARAGMDRVFVPGWWRQW